MDIKDITREGRAIKIFLLKQIFSLPIMHGAET